LFKQQASLPTEFKICSGGQKSNQTFLEKFKLKYLAETADTTDRVASCATINPIIPDVQDAGIGSGRQVVAECPGWEIQ